MEVITAKEAINKANHYLMMAASEPDNRTAEKFVRIAQTYIEIAAVSEDWEDDD